MAESQPKTPPRRAHNGNMPRSPITPEQVRRMEEARLRAKALRNQQLAAQTSVPSRTPSGFLTGDKRPHSALTSQRATTANQRDARQSPATASTSLRDEGIQAAKKFQKYVEYDFSKMTDTKAGFLTQEDDPFNKAMHSGNDKEDGRPPGMTLKEWEQRQSLKRMREARAGPFEPGINGIDLDAAQRKCRECGSLEIDFKWEEAFNCRVCAGCKDKFPDKYSLLTKTEAKEDYLLTDPELKDEKLLPHLDKPNPHKSTWNNMMLYLRWQVEEYAFSDKKWGSAEALDAEFERRQAEVRRRKELKFKNKLADLKRRTRVDAYRRRLAGEEGGDFGDVLRDGKHEHEWGRAVENSETGVPVKTCVECGMEVEELEF